MKERPIQILVAMKKQLKEKEGKNEMKQN